MNKLTIGLVGYGNVGSGVVKFLQKKRGYIRNKFQTEFVLKTICDKNIAEKPNKDLENIKLTTSIDEVVNDPEIQVVIELIGGLHPAKELVQGALKKGKHVITANKELI